jgi:hypothetical protein
MSDYQIIVLVCLAGIVAEAIRLIRPGQTLFTSGLTGRYGWAATPSEGAGGALRFHFAPVMASGPTFRVKEGSPAEARLDVPEAEKAVQGVFRASRLVLPGSQVLLVYLVGFVPLVLLGNIVPHGWKVLGATLAVLQVFMAVTFFLAHGKLHPQAVGDRIQHLVIMFFFPPAGVFASDHLANRTLDGLHPLAVALVLCPRDDARKMAEEYLRAWKNPLTGEDTEGVAAYLATAEKLLVERDWDPAVLAGPPEPDEAASLAFCPRCHAQFLTVEGTCPDCPGVAKNAFATSPGSSLERP